MSLTSHVKIAIQNPGLTLDQILDPVSCHSHVPMSMSPMDDPNPDQALGVRLCAPTCTLDD